MEFSEQALEDVMLVSFAGLLTYITYIVASAFLSGLVLLGSAALLLVYAGMPLSSV